jgi:hypothetical protein
VDEKSLLIPIDKLIVEAALAFPRLYLVSVSQATRFRKNHEFPKKSKMLGMPSVPGASERETVDTTKFPMNRRTNL